MKKIKLEIYLSFKNKKYYVYDNFYKKVRIYLLNKNYIICN